MYMMYALVNSVNSMRLQSFVRKTGFRSAWGLNPSCGRAPVVRVSVVEGAVAVSVVFLSSDDLVRMFLHLSIVVSFFLIVSIYSFSYF